MTKAPQLRNSEFLDPDRATPCCPHFGPCGGCQLQHLTYAAQLNLKAAHLQSLLAPLPLTLPALQLHPSPPLAYRNRIRLTLAQVDGQLRAGYLRNPATAIAPQISSVIPTEADHAVIGAAEEPVLSPSKEPPHLARGAPEAALSFLPITQCPIAAPILWNATEALLKLLNQRSAIWIERAPFTPPFTLDQLELFTTADESHLQISLFARTSAKSLPARFAGELAALCESLRLEIPALDGTGMYLIPPRPTRSRRTEQPRPGPTWGTPGLTYSISTMDESVILTLNEEKGKNPRISPLPLPVPQPATGNQQPATYWLPRGAFFQINRFLLPELLALVTSGRTGQLAWDLYAGVGLFSRALARSLAEVVAVEAAGPAASALASAKLPNLRTTNSTTLDFLRAAVLQRERPSLIVLDPPRSGAGPEVCALLARIATPTLIYISCSPEALSRDLAILTASGYTLAELHLLDLFPQTSHNETVAILTR